MTSEQFDCVVIGGGSAGLATAKTAAGLGARVALIEREYLGGTCVNFGCVPKKLLWLAAWQLRRAGDGDGLFPARFENSGDGFAGLKSRIRGKIETIRDSYRDDLASCGITHIAAEAEIAAPDRIAVDGRELTTDRLVLATGARPAAIDIPGADLAETSRDVLAWDAVPGRIAILGAGYIGCEFASIFRAFGADVHVIDPDDRVLDAFDAGLADAAQTAMARAGIDLIFGTKPAEIARAGDALALTLEDGRTLTVDRVVAAVGRTPNVDQFGDLSDRLERGRNDALAVSERFETSVPGIHAVGDAADRLPLTPVATRDGEALAHQLFGSGRRPIDLGLVATAAFVMPPVAQVGEFGPGDEGDILAPLEAGVLAVDDAPTAATFRKLAHDEAGRLTGAALMGEAAPEAIAPFAAILAAGAGTAALTGATGIHPSFLEEAVGRG